MWTVLEIILLGVLLMYASVSNFFSRPPPNYLPHRSKLINSIAGRIALFPRIDDTMFTGAVVPRARLHRLLRFHHIEIVPSFGWVSDTESTSMGVTRCWPPEIFIDYDFWRHMLHVRVHGILTGPDTDSRARWIAGGQYEHVPADEMGIRHTVQWNINSCLWLALGHRKSKCHHTI